MIRVLLVALGTLSLAIGIVGIFLPLLPTVPFVLLASVCYARASPRFHRWLLEHPRLGPPLVEWQRTKSLPARVKATAIGSVVVSATISIVFLTRVPWVRGVIAAVCAAVSVYLATIPTRRG